MTQTRGGVYGLKGNIQQRRKMAATSYYMCDLCSRTPSFLACDCGHQFCRECILRYLPKYDGPFPCLVAASGNNRTICMGEGAADSEEVSVLNVDLAQTLTR